jgi:REP element-mobilizing transposase RayT
MRPEHKARHPVHITLRVRPEVGRLRRRPIFQAVRRALGRFAPTLEFRVPHVSIQGNHLHLLVEATDKHALREGVQRLEIATARAINTSLGRTGKVFACRYHRTDITTPRQTRNALAYVLNNWRRHREDVSTPGAENVLLDPYATGWALDGWRDLDEPPSCERLPAAEPSTWLLRVGWRRHGALGVREVPGPLGS